MSLAAADARPSPVGSPAARTHRRARLLLVEDNADALRYLAAMLGHRGYEVVTASRVEEARAAAAASRFDLLISDIELPDGDGLELMRSHRGRLVGLAISGFGSDSDVRLSLDAGFSAHLTKPVDFARLEAAILKALGDPPP